MRRPGARSFLPLALSGHILLPTCLFAQDPVRRVSIAEALELFAENSLELKIARSEAAGLAAAALQSRAYANPAVSFGRDDLGHEGEKFWEETVLLVQQLEWPKRTTARGRAATHAIGAGDARFAADSIELAFRVREAYVQAWFDEQAEQVVRQTAAVIREVADDAERRLEAGDISGYEARRLRLERVQAEQAVATAELQARDSRRRLATMVAPGTGTEEIGPSEGINGAPPVVTRESALHSLPGRPDLVAAERELGAARAEEQVAASSWIPDPTVGVGYRHHLDGFGGASIALDLPVPVFDRGTGTRREASAESAAAAYRLDLRRRLARYDLMAASDRYVSGRARLEAGAPQLLADGEALLNSAGAAYAENEMTLVELLDAAGAFQGAQLSALSLRLEAWVAYYDLLRAMGNDPEDNE